MRRSKRSVVAVALTLLGSTIAQARTAPPAPAASAEPTAFVSIVAGRAFFQAADLSCTPYPDDATVDMFEIAERLKNRPRPIPVFGSIQHAFIRSGTRYCPGKGGYHDIYPTWEDMAQLRDNYGWSWGSNGRDLNYMTRGDRTPAQLWNTSCGALRDLRSHGHTRGWSLFSYPGGGDPDDLNDTVQRDYVAKCFSFARKYDNDPPFRRNTRRTEGSRTANPLGWQWTHNIYGGRCNLPDAPCASQPVAPFRMYENPATLADFLKPGADEWAVLQFHAFVDGQRLSGANDHWDCTGTDWRAHWTTRPELYCWNDFMTAIDAIPPGVAIVDPATVANHWGRVLPAPRVLKASPSTATAGAQVVLTTSNVRAVGSPANAFINGNGLTVRFGNTRAVIVSASATSVTVKVPRLSTAGAKPITLVNADGTTARATGLFSYRL